MQATAPLSPNRLPVVRGNPDGKENVRIKERVAPLADRFVGFEDQLNMTRTVGNFLPSMFIELYIY
jgi:hypothetical protein